MFTSDMTWVSVLLLRVCMPPPPTAPPLTAATPNTLATLLPAWFTCACHIQLFHMCLCHNAISQQRFLKQLSSCLQLNVVAFFFVTVYHALFGALSQLLPNPPYKKIYIHICIFATEINYKSNHFDFYSISMLRVHSSLGRGTSYAPVASYVLQLFRCSRVSRH